MALVSSRKLPIIDRAKTLDLRDRNIYVVYW